MSPACLSWLCPWSCCCALELSCIVFGSFALPKHSMHPRLGSLFCRVLFRPSCLALHIFLVFCIRVSCAREMSRKVIRDIRSSRGRHSRPVLSCFVCLVLSSYILHCLGPRGFPKRPQRPLHQDLEAALHSRCTCGTSSGMILKRSRSREI